MIGMLRSYLACLCFVVMACSDKKQASPGTGGGPAGAKAVLGRVGVRQVEGKAVDVRVALGGQVATYLKDAHKPRAEGVPNLMRLGELWATPTDGGTPRKLGNSVPNTPGGQLFSPDGKFVAFLVGFNVATQTGDLWLADLTHPELKSRQLASEVSYLVFSPDSSAIAFVTDGVLKVGPLTAEEFNAAAYDVMHAEFSPDSKAVFAKRKAVVGAGLLRVGMTGQGAKRFADDVGHFEVSPDGRFVAYQVRGTGGPDTYDLYVAETETLKGKRVAEGCDAFGFSPDGKWLARTMGAKKLEKFGPLMLGPPDGSAPKTLGESVGEFTFAPDSTGIAFLEFYDIPARAGVLAYAALPEGKAKRIGDRVPNFSWGANGKVLAFLSRFLKPVYSVDLMLFVPGEASSFKVREGVFGYEFSPNNERLLFRSACIREGRACSLYALDVAAPHAPPVKWVEGIFSYKASQDSRRVLVSYARTVGDLYDLGVFDVATLQHRTIDQFAHLPATFLDGEGRRVLYAVGDSSRQGVYLAQLGP